MLRIFWGMATIKVKFRASMALSREGSIYYQVLHERVPRQLLTDYRIFPSEWNARRATVECPGASPRAAYVLSVRERIRMDLERFGRIVCRFEKGRLEYTADDIVLEFERVKAENSLFNYMEGLIARLKLNGKVRTAETYRATLNSFRKFRGEEDILLDGLSREVMESYEAWQRQRGTSPNSISFYARVLRAVYNRAVEEELTEDRHPFRKVYTGVEKTVKRALPIATVRKIKGLDLSLSPGAEWARDMFIMSFMLRGMSLIDMAFLKKTDLQNGHIVYRRRKTRQLLRIKWTPEMQEIIDRYPLKDTAYLLPIIRNPDSVEVYAYRNAGYVINRHLREVGKSLDLPIPLTMYVARHSWASAAKAKGIPVSVISEGMGHDSELTTQIYLASLDTSVVDRANAVIIRELNGSVRRSEGSKKKEEEEDHRIGKQE